MSIELLDTPVGLQELNHTIVHILHVLYDISIVACTGKRCKDYLIVVVTGNIKLQRASLAYRVFCELKGAIMPLGKTTEGESLLNTMFNG